MGCFTPILFLVGFVMTMVTLIRWFEQTADAVDRSAWRELFMLIIMPFSVWLFPSRTAAGRPTAFPLHEPVRGFGGLPKSPPTATTPPPPATQPTDQPPRAPQPTDQPPPGTPKEFLELPKPKPAKPRAGPDPALVEKLRKKMRDQGMLPPE